MKTSVLLIVLALLAVSTFATNTTTNTTVNNTSATTTTSGTNSTVSTSTTCTKGDDSVCKPLGSDACCAYTSATLFGVKVQTYTCGLQSTFSSIQSAAKALGESDYTIYCANSVFMKVSAAVISMIAVVNFF